jgi:hypothetical protein
MRHGLISAATIAVCLSVVACGASAQTGPGSAIPASQSETVSPTPPETSPTISPAALPSVSPTISKAPSSSPTVTPPKHGQFSKAAPMVANPDLDATATLLLDGRVLITGSWAGKSHPTAAQLYNPTTRTFTATGSMTTYRLDYSVTRLADGRVLVAGGSGKDLKGLSSAELYDPKTGHFTATGSMTTVRRLQRTTLLNDGRVLLVGGQSEHEGLTTGEAYDPKTAAFTPANVQTSAYEAVGSATTLKDGRVLVVETDNGAPGDAAIYDPATNATSPVGTFATDFVGPGGGTGTVLKDGRIFLTNGTKIDLFDPATGHVTPVGTTKVFTYDAVRLSDGKVLIVGSPDTGSLQAEIFDPKTKKAKTTGSDLGTPLITATLLADGRVLCITMGEGALVYLP